ncbi:MAG: hypothetical protein JO336_11590, partial [Acidobacteriia bacterium]|nr:hypothetical protein [Terriglobia bacterium]
MSAQVSVLTAQNDNGRTSANLNETTLNTSNVNSSQFGKLFTRTVDGFVYAQPLYVPNVSIPTVGIRNVVYVATLHNTVFAFDATNPAIASPYWHRNLGPSVPTNSSYVPAGDYGGYGTETGILSTPVIDPTTNTLYAVALILQSGKAAYQLHALDITSGAERAGSPVTLSATVNGSGYDSQGGIIAFNPAQQLQRASLLLANGVLYIAFASWGDVDPYHGWILGYDSRTLQQVSALNVTPNGTKGGIWQSGGGLAADTNGFVYAIVGNGDWDGASNFGESWLKLNKNLTVADWFAPDNYGYLTAYDLDLGSARPMLVPGTSLAVSGGKTGTLYLLDRNNLGHMVPGDSQIVQYLSASYGQIFSGLACWAPGATALIYVWGGHDALKAYSLSGGNLSSTPASQSSLYAAYAAALSVSSNGSASGTGILWAYTPDSDPDDSLVTGTLHALDATDLSKELWNSDLNAARDAVGTFAKFVAPTVADGRVYLATFSNQLIAYGLLPSASAVSVTPHSVTLSASQMQSFTASAQVTWSISPAAGSISSSGIYTAPASISAAQTVVVTATSIANPANTATASVNLVPVSVAVSPAAVSLFASQSQQFTPSVAGSSNSGVSWTISPLVGSISSAGLYIAPAAVGSVQAVTVTATSLADPSKSTSAVVTLLPVMRFAAGETLGTARNDYTGWVGMQVTVGPSPVTVTAIGRFVASGNTGSHTVKIVDAATGLDIPGSLAAVNTLGSPAGTFAYSLLASPVTLAPSSSYYVLTLETANADSWYDFDTVVTTASVASLTGPVYGGNGSPYAIKIAVGHSYGPVDFSYTSIASAAVPPQIAQQPQGIAVAAGQPATFSVMASGTGLTYQWESKAPGASAFTPIAGATSSSYTKTAASASDNGAQFLCIVTNSQGSVASNAAVLTVTASAVSGVRFVTSYALGTLRNDYTGWVGAEIMVGPAPLTVTALARLVAPGNSGIHAVKIVDAVSGNDLPGASVTVNTAGGPSGSFLYAATAAPIVLAANATYYILTQENQGGDQWYDYDTTYQ